MQTATQLWQQVTGTAPDESARGLIVNFSIEAKLDEKASNEAGRPVYTEAEFIEIRSPNDPLSVIHREVENKDRNMYPQLYRRFKEGAQDSVTGTPLKEWPVIAKSQVDALAFRGIRTVEQFCDVSDDGCHQLGHGYLTLRNKAQAWLAKAKDASETTKLVALLAERDNEVQTLKRQYASLMARLDGLPEVEAAPEKPKKTKQANT